MSTRLEESKKGEGGRVNTIMYIVIVYIHSKSVYTRKHNTMEHTIMNVFFFIDSTKTSGRILTHQVNR